ncbi:MAG: VOC family protein [DPANN group archaeon]|nr:VOC family protein [DPANN group archaeon]
MPRVVHFEIDTETPERAIKFYKDVFGWTFKKWKGPMEYWQIMTGNPDMPGIDGGLVKREKDANLARNTIEVFSINIYITKIKDNHGTILMPKTPIPTIGYMAVFRDPEGNVLGLMESDETAR